MIITDIMQFKDEILKNLREMEKKIMSKVNKNQTDISSEITLINDSISLLKDNNNSLIDTIAQQKVNVDKISDIEKKLKKLNTSITDHDIRISDSFTEISYIRNRCEKSITETLSVPGIIGKNCRYSNFTEFIINNVKEMTSLKSDKDYNKNETKELKQKLEYGLKNLSNLGDTLINRSKLYTDNTKKIIIELMENKITQIEKKYMELMSKLYDINFDTEQKIKEFRNEIEDFNTTKNQHFKKMEEKFLLMNYNIDEINKKFDLAKEELNDFEKKKNQFKNDMNELKKKITNDINNVNNVNNQEYNYYNYSNSINNSMNFQDKNKNTISYLGNTIPINKYNDNNNEYKINYFNKGPNSPNSKKDKKSRISLLLNESNNIFNQINNNSNINNINQKNKNLPEINSLLNKKINKKEYKKEYKKENKKEKKIENIIYNEEMSQTDDNIEKKKESPIRKNIVSSKNISNFGIFDTNYLKSSKRKNTIGPRNLFNKNKTNYFSFDVKPIVERNTINVQTKVKPGFNLHKSLKDNKYSLEKYSSPNKIKSKINENKTKNEQKDNNELNNQKSLSNEDINNKTIISEEKSYQFKNNNYNSFPIIKSNKLSFSQEKKNNNELINKEFLTLESSNDNKNTNKNNKMNIGEETNKMCKFVKLSLDDNIITPYNTNGLLTIASKKYLNNHLIKIDESTPLNDIYLLEKLNEMKTSKNNNSYPKNMSNSSKITREINNDNLNKKNKGIYKNENSKDKKATKTINQGEAYQYGDVKFHFLKKK